MLRASSMREAGSSARSAFSLLSSETSSAFSAESPAFILAIADSILERVSFITLPPFCPENSKVSNTPPGVKWRRRRFAPPAAICYPLLMKTGRAELICTGSELLTGKLNLYAPLFHANLSALGFRIAREQCCGDSLEEIAEAVRAALKRSSLVIACGGLGPTFDDLTRQGAARALGRRLVYSKDCARILSFNYGLKKLPPNFRNQCLLLEGAKALENSRGTAFGQVLTRGRRMLVLLPGPRREWEPMFPNFLDEEIR
ncbi:MAG TPA: hypothetical protein DEQ38_06735, partial [Elusimicrobia bacterium]|nr:hypothetical protein [Elusimicrobiota bacterium]